MKILVIDDDLEDQKMTGKLLRRDGVEFVNALGVVEAEKLLTNKKTHFDMIICDGLYGEWESGVDIAKKHGNVPFLLRSAENKYLQLAKEKGIAAINKTAPVPELIEAVFPAKNSRGPEVR